MNRLLVLVFCFVGLPGCDDGATQMDGGATQIDGGVDAAIVTDAAPSSDAGPLQLVLRGRFMMDPAADVAVHASRPLVAVSTWWREDVLLIDVSDPTSPTQTAIISNIGYNSDVQFKDNLLYINHQRFNMVLPGRGIDIYDVTDAANPGLVAMVSDSAGDQGMLGCHNTWPQPDRQLLYCASTVTGEVVVLSTGEGGVGSPTAPIVVSTISSPGTDPIHDMYARGNRLYAAFLGDGFSIHDITDPANPIEIATHNYANSFTHNLWPSEDGQYLFTTDENLGGHVRVFDISNLNSINEVANYQPVPAAIVHNIEVVGTFGYISHYTAGLRIIDVADPTNPTEIAVHDFFPGADVTNMDIFTGFHGAWGVEPKFPFVYVSGIESGLWIYELVAP